MAEKTIHLGNDEHPVKVIVTGTIENTVSYDNEQALNDTQKDQARKNIDTAQVVLREWTA